MKRFDPRVLAAGGLLALAFLVGVATAPSLNLTAAANAIGNAAGDVLAQTEQNGPHGNDLYAAAATYIGITAAELKTELQAGKSLADVAVAHGKTRDGLILALTQADQTRITTLVDQKGLATGKPGAGVRGGLPSLSAAATYLGISTTDLETKLRAGQSLAQIAGSTAGKDRAGLVKALVAEATTKIDQAQQSGKLTAPQASQAKADLQTRIEHFVDQTGLRGSGNHRGR
jgi:hypothetical protein